MRGFAMVVHRRGTWRSVALVGAALGMFAVTACTGADSGSGGGKLLRYGYDLSAQFTNTFDPAKSTGDCDQVVTHFIYDSLLRRDENTGAPMPGLAKSWTVRQVQLERQLAEPGGKQGGSASCTDPAIHACPTVKALSA